MTDFAQNHFAHVVEAAKENSETLAKGLELCFGQPCSLENGPPTPLPEEEERGEQFADAGLIIGMRAGESGLVAILPESFPLPEWYKAPDEAQLSQLQNLAMEWSSCLFTEELMPEEYTAFPFESLNQAISLLDPTADAEWLPVTVTTQDAETPGVMYLLGAVEKPCANSEILTQQQHEEEEAPAEEPVEASESNGAPTVPGDFSIEERHQRAKRVKHLSVNVTVRLAQKRIDMSQLRTLSPGSLIMFNKNCEELLDLYVNNTPYCRGEVVKVGENFGLKVDEVGYYIEPEAKVI